MGSPAELSSSRGEGGRPAPPRPLTYLNGQCDVCVGTEAPAPIARAMVEAAPCGKTGMQGHSEEGSRAWPHEPSFPLPPVSPWVSGHTGQPELHAELLQPWEVHAHPHAHFTDEETEVQGLGFPSRLDKAPGSPAPSGPRTGTSSVHRSSSNSADTQGLRLVSWRYCRPGSRPCLPSLEGGASLWPLPWSMKQVPDNYTQP